MPKERPLLFFDSSDFPSPTRQAIFSFILSLTLMLFVKLAFMGGLLDTDAELFWVVSAAFILLYAFVSSLLSLGAKFYFEYLQQAVLSFCLLLIGSAVAAGFFSSLSILEIDSFRMIYMVLLVAYFALLILAYFIFWIAMLLHRKEDEEN